MVLYNDGQLKIPRAYLNGYELACLEDHVIARNYVAHTTIGDPAADAIVEELAPLRREEVSRFIHAGMEEDRKVLRAAPQALRDFFMDAPQPDPDWLDRDALAPGIRAFQRNAVPVLAAFVTGTLMNGFSTLISKSFVQTGRIFDNGVWRLKQNNRHQMEIFWPGGLERHGDGWKLSVRIRFVHAQVRRLLAETEQWHHDEWGVPISAAHLGYAAANFASGTLKHSSALGARYSDDERAGFHAVWRYAGYLMGIPETILFTDANQARELCRIAVICEPPPTAESVIMTNALINSAPLVAGITDPEARKRLVNRVIYPVARGLVGNQLADALQFPRSRLPFPLLSYRLDRRLQRLLLPLRRRSPEDFSTLLTASAYDDTGMSYRLPTHAHDERSRAW
ncbi:MAG: oxygenase MpaB family protein [Chloroflexi bacterium]|nr:oxygenase MpaB family protein [Chloroflexota bacterium]